VFGTLRLGAISAAQDRVFQLRTLPTWLGFDPVVEGGVEGGFGYLGLPAWGFLLQPVAFVLVLIAVSLLVGRRSADASSELLGGFRAAYGGLPFALFRLAEHVRLLLMSCVLTSVFLGGWTIPYLSQATIVAAVGYFYDGEFANLVCMVLHVTTYAIKVGVLVFAQLLLANVLPVQRYDQMMKLCWKVLLPLGLANVFATAVGILVWGGPA
jgi:NADH-quinone oxidoreductase subunit H